MSILIISGEPIHKYKLGTDKDGVVVYYGNSSVYDDLTTHIIAIPETHQYYNSVLILYVVNDGIIPLVTKALVDTIDSVLDNILKSV